MKARELFKLLKDQGWSELPPSRGKGGHRMFQKDGKRVTIPSLKLSDDVPKGTLGSILRTAGLK